MQVTGIIAEYNPFHNGHQYQLETIRQKTHADYILVAMSGNFLQRGVPAIMDKYARAQIALSCGADLVLELPALWSCASAEYFASAGVALMEKTGVVTALGYGTECAETDLPLLFRLAKLLSSEPAAYRKLLQSEQKKGRSFPAARAAALRALLPKLPAGEPENLLASPNNILALEYEKALRRRFQTPHRSITTFPLRRIGAGYHDERQNTAFPSASAIRRFLLSGENEPDFLKTALPEKAFRILENYRSEYPLLSEASFSAVLGYRLWELQKKGYDAYADCSKALSNRILNHLEEYTDFSRFCHLLKTRELTYTRISRALLHILLHQTEADYAFGQKLDYIPYLRVLGFRKSAVSLLSAIKKEASVPMITKPADASFLLPKDAYRIFEMDQRAADLYRQTMTAVSGKTVPSECRRELIRL